MPDMKLLFYCILLKLMFVSSQFNLYFTNDLSELHNQFQHNCLRVDTDHEWSHIPRSEHKLNFKDHREIISICMSELPSKFHIEDDRFIKTYTFDELSKQNVNSEQLYLWSTPIDIIENYQLYLKQDSSLANEIFYNCTLPRFGPKCQYQLNYGYPDDTPSDVIINEIFINLPKYLTDITCYISFKCDRGSSSICLDWTEVCDGVIDCLDTKYDEKYCWELEINVCRENEYRCKNGQCIPKLFYNDRYYTEDCIDASDELDGTGERPFHCTLHNKPSIVCQSFQCKRDILTSSCLPARAKRLSNELYLTTSNHITDDCWSIVKCLLAFLNLNLFEFFRCNVLCNRDTDTCKEMIMETCPDFVYFPNYPVLFGDIYFAISKIDLQSWFDLRNISFYICYNTSHYDSYFLDLFKISSNNVTCVSALNLDFSEKQTHTHNPFIAVVSRIYNALKVHHLIFNYTSEMCDRSNLYQCDDSPKCISIHRILDGQDDCPYRDDEIGKKIKDVSFMEQLKEHTFKCEFANIYIPFHKVEDDACDCVQDNNIGQCEDEKPKFLYRPKNVLFQYICDGSVDSLLLHYTEQNVTDETNCERWDCHDVYTHCNTIYDCPAAIDEVDCDLVDGLKEDPIERFKLPGMALIDYGPLGVPGSKVHERPFQMRISRSLKLNCYYGIQLKIWLDYQKNLTAGTCLCPSIYFGAQCQYQNQRIILIIKFRVFSDSWHTSFAIVISLIDNSDQRTIHSYEQITYLSTRDCSMKYNINLFYSTRPKNETNQYAIHIDFYEKDTLNYRGSILLPIKFTFLPINHLAHLISIPKKDEKQQNCYNSRCIKGKCIRYLDNPENYTFCQCNPGWKGKYCTIRHVCTCSSDSLCIGIGANNRSICVCSKNTFGPRCMLTNQVCQINDNSTCQNGGQCVPNDDYVLFKERFACICPKNSSGKHCEIDNTKLILTFNENIQVSQDIYIHFFEIFSTYKQFTFTMRSTGQLESVIRSTAFKKIPLRKDSVTIYWSQPFHLVFAELSSKTYYLVHIQTIYSQSTIVNKSIESTDHCPNITEVFFNDTFKKLHLVTRIKFYHFACQNQSLNLSCFHDEFHLCLCYQWGKKRLANCFKFDHDMKLDCNGQSECENDGKCLQDHRECPTRTLCLCKPCYFGSRCQLSTNGLGLSLDAILSYHIQPNMNFLQQSSIIKFTFGLTIICTLLGLVNAICSILTFKNKSIREVGCGIYLLGSSITSLLTTILFGLKFFILLYVQMNFISNRSFLSGQCSILDFLLRVFLNMDQWLNACVATERAVTTVQGARFVKKKSKKMAIYVVSILFLVITASFVHDPIHRQLIEEINDDDENTIKRIWCVVKYNSGLQLYNNIIQGFHFVVPFLINIVSTIILIRTKIYQQLTIHSKHTFREMLWKQLKEHKHLLTAPIILVILSLPRLVLTYLLKCMNSTNDAWIFINLYFISFIPSMVTSIVFILPSKYYKKEFSKSIKQLRENIRKPFNRQSY